MLFVSNDEDEVYRSVRRDLTRAYYSGRLTKEEYDSKLLELDEKRYGKISTSRGFSLGSIWDAFDLPPERFHFWVSVEFLGLGSAMIIAVFVIVWTFGLDILWPIAPPLVSLRPGFEDFFGLMAFLFLLIAPFLIILGIGWFRHWRKKRSSGEYALHQERYWETHEPPPPP